MSQGTDEEVQWFVIVGHSEDTDERFDAPINTNIIFKANEGETCYMNENTDDLNINFEEIAHFEKHKINVKNYKIKFELQNNGIWKCTRNGEHWNYEHLIDPNTISELISLEDCCKYIIMNLKKNGNKQINQEINIFCIICRGDKEEFNGIQSPGRNYNPDIMLSPFKYSPNLSNLPNSPISPISPGLWDLLLEDEEEKSPQSTPVKKKSKKEGGTKKSKKKRNKKVKKTKRRKEKTVK